MIRYYGGKFNPITRGHLGIVKTEVESLGEFDCLVIGICNCTKEEFESRRVLVDGAVRELFADKPEMLKKIGVVRQTDPSLWNFFSLGFWFNIPGIGPVFSGPAGPDIVIVLGDDEFNDLIASFNENGNIENAPWRFAREIYDKFRIMRYDRVDNVSSSAVRSLFHRDPHVTYAAVEQYITREVWNLIESRKMYGQVGFEDECAMEERVALLKYDPKKFEQPSATVDIIATRGTFGKKDAHDGEILLIRRKNHPYKGFWALPGGFLDVGTDPTLEYAATREFREETNIDYGFTPQNQFRTYSDMGSDPRCRIVDTVYATAVDYFGDCGGDDIHARAGDDAAELEWFPMSSLPRLAFNHRKIIEDWIIEHPMRLRSEEVPEEFDNIHNSVPTDHDDVDDKKDDVKTPEKCI